MPAEKDFYAILGVSKDASAEDVKKAYRRLARQFHPDVNKGDKKAEERFKEISAAFEVLGDPAKRKLYDEFGPAGLRSGFNPDEAREWRRWGGGVPSGGAPAGGSPFGGAGPFGGGDAFDFSSILEDLFRQSAGRPARAAGADIEASLEVDLADAALGAERDITVERPTTCESCGGSGQAAGAGARTCPTCHGTGRERTGGRTSMNRPCRTCGGTGALQGPPCPVCGGAGEVSRPTRLRVRIPSGVEEGSRIRLAGQGGPGVAGGPPGDLLLQIRLREHPKVRREGLDLYMDLPLTVREALEGTEVEVPVFGGRVSLRVPPGTQSGGKLRLRGKGMPSLKGTRGDLYFVARVLVPVADVAEVKEAARVLDRHYAGAIRADLAL